MYIKKIKEFIQIFLITFFISFFLTLWTIDHEINTERKNNRYGCNKYPESSLINDCLKKMGSVPYKDYEKRYLVSMFYQSSLMTMGIYWGRSWYRNK